MPANLRFAKLVRLLRTLRSSVSNLLLVLNCEQSDGRCISYLIFPCRAMHPLHLEQSSQSSQLMPILFDVVERRLCRFIVVLNFMKSRIFISFLPAPLPRVFYGSELRRTK